MVVLTFWMIKSISITWFNKTEPLGKLVRRIKTRRRFYFWEYLSFESDRSGSLRMRRSGTDG
jgi:hypothetical protein